MTSSNKRIALGMSGGVDSSVAVSLLLHAGYEVLGVTCRFVDDEKTAQSVLDAREVCRRFGISHIEWSCEDSFRRCVVEPFVKSYAAGKTPSPCVGCNAYAKLPGLLEAADAHGCDKVATGHYARVVELREEDGLRYAVLSALDYKKDQSYMLCMLSQAQLGRLVLPLGGVTKTHVRILAAELGLSTAERPDSQDVCFIEGDYRPFLRGCGVFDQPGDIVNERGDVLGRHDGLFNYTLGQRKGIGVAGPEPYYVIRKDSAKNQLVIGFSNEAVIHEVVVGQMNWQAFEGLHRPMDAMVKLRYRSEPAACAVEPIGDDRVRVRLQSAQAPTAPGQYAVFYQGSTVLGGGVIEEALA